MTNKRGDCLHEFHFVKIHPQPVFSMDLDFFSPTGYKAIFICEKCGGIKRIRVVELEE